MEIEVIEFDEELYKKIYNKRREYIKADNVFFKRKEVIIWKMEYGEP